MGSYPIFGNQSDLCFEINLDDKVKVNDRPRTMDRDMDVFKCRKRSFQI